RCYRDWSSDVCSSDLASLEAMSGSGRLLIPLLQQGRNVHGADLSPAMVESCAARLSAAGLSTPLFRQDVVTLNLPFRYVAAIFRSEERRVGRESGSRC